MSDPHGFDSLADCIQDILDEDDPELETITFHVQGCISEREDDCDCAPYTVPMEDIYFLGPAGVAEKLEPLLGESP